MRLVHLSTADGRREDGVNRSITSLELLLLVGEKLSAVGRHYCTVYVHCSMDYPKSAAQTLSMHPTTHCDSFQSGEVFVPLAIR